MIDKLRINIQDTDHVTNVYIVWDEISQEAVLIDPADKASIISDRIEKLGLKLKYVLLTKTWLKTQICAFNTWSQRSYRSFTRHYGKISRCKGNCK